MRTQRCEYGDSRIKAATAQTVYDLEPNIADYGMIEARVKYNALQLVVNDEKLM